MASIIKNQILKHLSKFTKNLNVDQISLEVLRGRGELSNIELDEAVLTEVCDLPSWVRIERAVCTRVAVKVPWAKLKTSAVKIYIDEIQVVLKMSSKLRDTTVKSESAAKLAAMAAEQSYGFANRVVDGMSLYINSLEFSFTSEVFRGSIALSRLSIESKTPAWQKPTSLRATRISNHAISQFLLFKEMTWQTVRIEASSSGQSAAISNAPIRLITSCGRLRMAFRKSSVDGATLASRLQLILDDILWVATLPQVRSAILFYRYLSDLVKLASDLTKADKAKEQLKNQKSHPGTQGSHASRVAAQSNLRTDTHGIVPGSPFERLCIYETSHHVYAGNIDLHICDDGSKDNKDINFPEDWNIHNGAVQVSLVRISCDIYPYHLAKGRRDYWVHYKDKKAQTWTFDLLNHYEEKFSLLFGSTCPDFRDVWSHLMAQCVVIRVSDLVVHPVNTGTKPDTDRTPLLAFDREALHLPEDMPVLQVELSEYYYAKDDAKLPVPARSTFIQLNPIKVFLDKDTIRWANYIYLDISCRLKLKPEDIAEIPHADIRIELLTPRIIIPASLDWRAAKEQSTTKKPTALQIQVGSAVMTNTTVGAGIKPNDLRTSLSDVVPGRLFQELTGSSFAAGTTAPNYTIGGFTLHPLPVCLSAFKKYLASIIPVSSEQFTTLLNDSRVEGATNKKFAEKKADSLPEMEKILAIDDIWTVQCKPLWIEFVGNKLFFPKPMPLFLDANVTIWIVQDATHSLSRPSSAWRDLSCDSDAPPPPSSDRLSAPNADPHRVQRRSPSPRRGQSPRPSSMPGTGMQKAPSPRPGSRQETLQRRSSRSTVTPDLYTHANAYVIIKPESGLKIVFDHYQYLTFVQTMEALGDFFTVIDNDTKYFMDEPQVKGAAIAALIPWLQLGMILPRDAPLSPYDEPPGPSFFLNSAQVNGDVIGTPTDDPFVRAKSPDEMSSPRGEPGGC